MKKPKALLFLAVLVVALVTFRLATKWRAADILLSEQNLDVTFDCLGCGNWSPSDGSVVGLLAIKSVTVSITGDLKRAKQIGGALSVFGSIKEFTCSRNYPEAVDDIFDGLPKGQRLNRLYLSSMALDDHFVSKLAKFSKVAVISIIGGEINGEQWPAMPELEDLDVSYCLITNRGLKQILLSCPKIKRLEIKNSKVTTSGVDVALAATGNRECTIVISGIPDLSDDWSSEMTKRYPNVDLRCD